MEIKQGLMLSLKCRVQGDKNPVIKWFKDGVPIESKSDPYVNISSAIKQSQLRIRSIRLKDSGNYSCIGSSDSDQMSRWVYVTVIPNSESDQSELNRAQVPCDAASCSREDCQGSINDSTCKCRNGSMVTGCSKWLTSSASTERPTNQGIHFIEEDFVLDQSQASLPTRASYGKPVDGYVEKCTLPEFVNSSECVQVNSHFYAFIGTALACSIVILLLGSCLGYLRRRKILNQRRRLNSLEDTRGDKHAILSSDEKQKPRVSKHSTTASRTKYAHVPPSNLYVPSVNMPIFSAASGYTANSTLLNNKRNNSFLSNSTDFESTSYVVFTSTTPITLHPIAVVPTPADQTSPTHKIVYTPRSLTLDSQYSQQDSRKQTGCINELCLISRSQATVQQPMLSTGESVVSINQPENSCCSLVRDSTIQSIQQEWSANCPITREELHVSSAACPIHNSLLKQSFSSDQCPSPIDKTLLKDQSTKNEYDSSRFLDTCVSSQKMAKSNVLITFQTLEQLR